jgi:hypothetical protein
MSYSLDEIRAAGLDDFRVFLRQVWDYLTLPPPTPVQNDIANWLQHGPRRAQLQAFRGVGKSWITVAFVLWCLLLNPQLKIMVVSANEQLANDFTKFCKQLIHGMPLLQHLAPRAGQRDSSFSFDVGPALDSKDPSVKSAGITGQITGSRADIIIPDDIEVPKNSYTHGMRERLAELVKEFDAVLKPNGRILYLGTPQTESSLYNRLPARGYQIRIYPAEVPQTVDRYSGRLAPFVVRRIEAGWKPGTPLDPQRFSEEDLMERRLSLGKSGYALQYMLDTSPSSVEKHPLKLRDLIITDIDSDITPVKLAWGQSRELVIQDLAAGGFDGDFYHKPAYASPDMTTFGGTVMALDPSGRGNDETAGAIVRFSHGMLYLVAVFGFMAGFSEDTLKAIARIGAHHKVQYVVAEENYGGGMFNQLLKPYLLAAGAGRFDDDWKGGWSHGQKENRILDTMEPLLANHRLVVDRRVIEEDRKIQEERQAYSFVYQMTRIERTRGALAHDDRLEAVSMACRYWVDRMDRDRDKSLDAVKRKALDEELRKIKQHVLGVGKARRLNFNNR